jgi:transcriptional regulator with XRE-family HTH domain
VSVAEALAAAGFDDLATLIRSRELAVARGRELREAAGLSLAEVGAAIGTSAASIQRWELGQRTPHGELAARYGALLEALAS